MDEDEDLDNADRGDELPRDDQGRFAKKEGEVAETEVEETEEETEVEETEEETEVEETEEETEAAEEEDDDGGKDDKNLAIRLAKMRDQRDRERQAREELQRQVEAAKAEKPPAQQTQQTVNEKIAALNAEVDALYEQVEDARIDGKTREAAALQRQIDQKNREIGRIESYVMTARQTAALQQNTAYDSMLEVLEATYVEMDPESDDYDPDTVTEMEELVQAFEARGLSAPEALRKATKAIFREDPFARRPKREARAKEEAAPAAKLTPKKPDTKKALDTMKRQPPDTSSKGVNKGDDTKIRISELSEEEFDKLPESKKAEYRGDFVA
jgi:chromosome segregation ATPase